MQRGEALAAHYASADVFLFPSLSDTFGNVVLEALASGLPVVSFDVAAAAEHVRDGRSGRLVVAGDEAGFIAAVARAGRRRGVRARRCARKRSPPPLAPPGPRSSPRFEAHLEATLHESQEAPPASIPVVA